MKNTLAILALVLLLQACSKSKPDKGQPASIVGKWVWKETVYNEMIDGVTQPPITDKNPLTDPNLFIQFNADSSGVRSEQGPAGYILTRFQYTVSGSALTLLEAEVMEKDTVTTLSESSLTIHNRLDLPPYVYITDHYYQK